MERPLLPADKRTAAVTEQIASFHRETVDEVIAAVTRDRVVVVGMSQNPFVKRVRKALDGAGITFRYLEYGGYHNQWRRRLAIKLWSGYSTFPQVFVDGVLIGGAEETEAAIAAGELAPA
ncbi:MAG: glutaredoxin [Myxococcales bacterium]|nr:glutaredoxin [Myxococcales bacterium]